MVLPIRSADLRFLSESVLFYKYLFSSCRGSLTQLQICQSRRQELRRGLEDKLSMGLEQCLTLALTRIQLILSSEQRKADFKSELPASNSSIMNPGVGSEMSACSPVCFIVQYNAVWSSSIENFNYYSNY